MRYPSNRKGVLFTVIAMAAALFSTAASATLTALPATFDPTTNVVTIGVHLTGHARPGYTPLGSVVFTEGNKTLGTVQFGNCDVRTMECDYRLALPGYALRPHTITASYSGDQPQGSNPPDALTFVIFASKDSWLPAVLDLLSD